MEGGRGHPSPRQKLQMLQVLSHGPAAGFSAGVGATSTRLRDSLSGGEQRRRRCPCDSGGGPPATPGPTRSSDRGRRGPLTRRAAWPPGRLAARPPPASGAPGPAARRGSVRLRRGPRFRSLNFKLTRPGFRVLPQCRGLGCCRRRCRRCCRRQPAASLRRGTPGRGWGGVAEPPSESAGLRRAGDSTGPGDPGQMEPRAAAAPGVAGERRRDRPPGRPRKPGRRGPCAAAGARRRGPVRVGGSRGPTCKGGQFSVRLP
jgi:hypothetical protein